MNTVIPYTNGHYYDARKTIVIEPHQVNPINDTLGFYESAKPLKDLFDEDKVGIIQGIGYPNSNRSHFRGMDIWHTCEPDKLGTEMCPRLIDTLSGFQVGKIPIKMALRSIC